MADNKPTAASSADSFSSELAKYYPKSSPEREVFVFNSILKFVTKGQIEASMKPITVNGPNNTKITFKVMPDYVMIGSTRVPMAANTAKRVAGHFGLKVPDSKMTELVYQNADVQVAAKPLSGSGAVVDGKRYSGQQVVDKGVDYAGFVNEYNKKINQELDAKKVKPGQIVSGFAKDIVDLPGERKDKNLGLHGFYNEKGVPIGAASPTGGTSHDTTMHSEYGAFLRLVSDDVEVTDASGKKTTLPAEQLSNLMSGGKITVEPPKDQKKPTDFTPSKPAATSAPAKPTKPSTSTTGRPPRQQRSTTPATRTPSTSTPSTGTSSNTDFDKINQFLSAFSAKIKERRENLVKRAMIFISES